TDINYITSDSPGQCSLSPQPISDRDKVYNTLSLFPPFEEAGVVIKTDQRSGFRPFYEPLGEVAGLKISKVSSVKTKEDFLRQLTLSYLTVEIRPANVQSQRGYINYC
ncbi:hypothetical protein BgiBS90_004784, partial [Biomphalaria glabrata]